MQEMYKKMRVCNEDMDMMKIDNDSMRKTTARLEVTYNHTRDQICNIEERLLAEETATVDQNDKLGKHNIQIDNLEEALAKMEVKMFDQDKKLKNLLSNSRKALDLDDKFEEIKAMFANRDEF